MNYALVGYGKMGRAVEERARLAKNDRFDFFADAVVKSVGGMLDEPTSGVDPITRREFWNHINGLVGKGVTAERLAAKGYGEGQPLVETEDDVAAMGDSERNYYGFQFHPERSGQGMRAGPVQGVDQQLAEIGTTSFPLQIDDRGHAECSREKITGQRPAMHDESVLDHAIPIGCGGTGCCLGWRGCCLGRICCCIGPWMIERPSTGRRRSVIGLAVRARRPIAVAVGR